MYSPVSDPAFNRTKLLVGDDVMSAMGRVRVILFGVGGVGSWCAEGLVRSGITHLTLVDSDCVSQSNINRQLMATARTVGQVKVEALRDRLLEINPQAEITALQRPYNADTAESFQLESFDYILDAIDSLKEKSDLILRVSARCGYPQEIQAEPHVSRPQVPLRVRRGSSPQPGNGTCRRRFEQRMGRSQSTDQRNHCPYHRHFWHDACRAGNRRYL